MRASGARLLGKQASLVLGCAASLFLLACAAHRTAPAVAPAPDPAAELARADALLAHGCHACLVDALDIYARLEARAYRPAVLRRRVFDAAILLAARERELALPDSGALQRAKEAAAALADPALGTWAEFVDRLPPAVEGTTRYSEGSLIERLGDTYKRVPEWRSSLASREPTDDVAAYLLVSLDCTFPGLSEPGAGPPDKIAAAHPRSLAIRYRAAICAPADVGVEQAVVRTEPRFVEVEYFVGLDALKRQRFEEADARFEKVFAQLPQTWAAPLALGNLHLTMEEFQESVEYYDKALALAPEHREALYGKGKALSYLGRHEEALAVFDRMLALGTWFIGDAHYWRAWNLYRMKQLEAAWADAQAARPYLVNADLLQLSGLIAFDRGDMKQAREDFSGAIEREPKDCLSLYYLGRVDVASREWRDAATRFGHVEACSADAARAIADRIAEIDRSEHLSTDRKARLLAAERWRADEVHRMDMAAAYNAAVSFFSLGERDEAVRHAERAVEDEQWRSRAQDLIARARQASRPQP